jgi:hypothetical protein
MDIHGYHSGMKNAPPKRKRPAVLVRFYPTDLARLSKVCADQCTPRENYIRRAVLAVVTMDERGAKVRAK